MTDILTPNICKTNFFANYLEKPKRGVIFVAVNKSEDGLGLAQEFAKPHFFLRKSTEIGYSV